MGRLASISQFRSFQSALAARPRNGRRVTVVVPAGTCGLAGGAGELIDAARRELQSGPLAGQITLRVTGCHGYCQMEPSILVLPQGVFYPRVAPANVPRILRAAAAGQVAEPLLSTDPATGKRIALQKDIPFFRRQVRTILADSENVDPTNIDSYLAAGGYAALLRVLDGWSGKQVIDEVKASGLRGRGGAGFPTGAKWEMLARQPGDRGKYLVCNGDEGDPGAYMDRSVLEGNPQRVLEGMLIGAFATGATQGVIYVRTEYPLAVKHVAAAIVQARDLGVLGPNVLGSGLSFDVKLVKGAGAFVCGEETALIRSIEGAMGEPRQRPPFPVQRGIHGRPTAINNVETWANIPAIIGRGAAAFRTVGTPGSAGTKIFSLVGKIRNTGLVEVPMGLTLGELIGDIGGGPSGTSPVKAVQTGGPSGGCIPASRFDLPIDYDSLSAAGSIMGSGGLIVMDQSTCMVDLARYFMNFLMEESCGKCFTCRKGTQRMHELLDDICAGRGTLEQLDLLEELAQTVKDTTMCGLGQTAANPVLSALRYFRDEFREHIVHRRCPAAVCKALITYSIRESCTGCQACAKVCPAKAVAGERKQRHTIDSARCTRCGACASACKFEAVAVA